MNLFKDCVAYQEEVRDPTRIAETLNRVILQAKRASAPAQINIPRDFWTQIIDIELPAIVEFERPSGGEDAISQAAASILTDEVKGMTLEEAKNFPKEKLLEMIGVPLSMARVKCALLSLKVMKAGAYGIPEKTVMRGADE